MEDWKGKIDETESRVQLPFIWHSKLKAECVVIALLFEHLHHEVISVNIV